MGVKLETTKGLFQLMSLIYGYVLKSSLQSRNGMVTDSAGCKAPPCSVLRLIMRLCIPLPRCCAECHGLVPVLEHEMQKSFSEIIYLLVCSDLCMLVLFKGFDSSILSCYFKPCAELTFFFLSLIKLASE